MPERPAYGPPLDENEVSRLVDLTFQAFGTPDSQRSRYLEEIDASDRRVLRDRGGAVAGLVLLPMAQSFGGRWVPMTGVADVAVAPEHWGRGAATDLLRSALRELRSARVALSTLFPATLRLYRGVGYEPAGCAYDVTLSTERIDLVERDLPLRPIEESDREAIEEAQRAYALRRPAHLDRCATVWRTSVRSPRGERAEGYLVEAHGTIEGYLYLIPRGGPEWPRQLELTDLVALTPRAARRLLTFLRDHRAQFESVRFRGSPHDPLLSLLPELGYRVRLHEHWMLRIVDVEAALEARGYPEGVRAELHLTVHDPLLSENDGRFVLELSEGRAKVTRGGEGRIALDVRALAPLYTGHLSPEALRSAGLLEGPEADLRAAAPVFAGDAPWMIDHF